MNAYDSPFGEVIWYKEDHKTITLFSVVSNNRKGSELLVSFEGFIRSNFPEVTSLYLIVSDGDGLSVDSLVRFYRKHGFKVQGDRNSWSPFMVKRIRKCRTQRRYGLN